MRIEHRIPGAAHIPVGTGRTVEVDGMKVAVYNVAGQYYCIDDFCPHQRGSLGRGRLDGALVFCPEHNWIFNVTTGGCLHGSLFDRETFPVKVDGDDLIVSL